MLEKYWKALELIAVHISAASTTGCLLLLLWLLLDYGTRHVFLWQSVSVHVSYHIVYFVIFCSVSHCIHIHFREGPYPTVTRISPNFLGLLCTKNL